MPGGRTWGRNFAPGMRWSIDHWSRCVNAPAATSTASTAKAPASRAPLRGNTHAHRRGDDLEARGCRADLLAVELDRKPLGCIDRGGAGAEQLDLRVRDVRALVDLGRRRHEIALRHVADEDDVEQPVVGLR